MKSKRVSLNDEERIALQTMVSLEIKNNKEADELGIEPVWKTKDLKTLYKKLTGYERKKNRNEEDEPF